MTIALAGALLSMMVVQEGTPARAEPAERVQLAAESAVAEELDRGEIPGMAVVLVYGGEVILSRGWGLADVAKNRRVDPERTIFRLGSLSKLITATAVMQLVEEGRLGLNDPAQDFLGGLPLPVVGREPVTVHHLLTHSAGLDEHVFGQYGDLEEAPQSLEEYLSGRSLVGRWPAGEVISYSDHAYALLGRVVEVASGDRFERYVERALFEPLEMRQSSISPRLDPADGARMARGYHRTGDRLRRRPEHVFHTYPSVALAGTAAELGRFLLLHLRAGEGPAGTRVLEPETLGIMHATQVSHHPAFDGRGYGFSFRRFGDHRALYHDGSTTGFTSRMLLVPESGFGFLLVYNHGFYGAGGSPTRAGRFKTRFTDRVMAVLPAPSEPGAAWVVAGAGELGGSVKPGFLGAYREVPSHSVHTLEKVNILFGQRKLEEKGAALLLDGQPVDRVQSDLFRTRAGELFSLRRSRDGQHLLMAGNTAWVRAGWLERADVQAGLAALLVLIFLAAAVTGGFSALRSRGKGMGEGLGWTVSLVGALNLGAVVGTPGVLYRADLHDLFFGPPLAVYLLAAFPLVAGVLGLGLAADLALGRARRIRLLPRWWVGLVVVATLAWLPWLHHWRLWSVWTWPERPLFDCGIIPI